MTMILAALIAAIWGDFDLALLFLFLAILFDI
jgi:hypothetical protein